jgi:ferrous iron transport protein A
MGFSLGVELEVVQNFGRGPIIVKVRDTRVALGRGEATHIQVEAIND